MNHLDNLTEMRTESTTSMEEEVHRFHPRKIYLVIGIIGTIFFSVAGIGSVLAAIFNIDGSFARPVLTAVILGTGWSGFTLLSLWCVAAYYRESLLLSNELIVQQGVIFTRTLTTDEVVRINWILRPTGGSMLVVGRWRKIKIHLDNFLQVERRQIVEYFREQFPSDLHEGGSGGTP